MLLLKSAGCSSETPPTTDFFPSSPAPERGGRKEMGMLFAINQGKEKKREIVAPFLFLREVESCVMRGKSEGFHRWMLRAFLDCFSPKLIHSKIRKLQFSSFRGNSLYQLHRTAKPSTRQIKNTSRCRKDFLEDFFLLWVPCFDFCVTLQNLTQTMHLLTLRPPPWWRAPPPSPWASSAGSCTNIL